MSSGGGKLDGPPKGQQQNWPGHTDEMRPRPDHGEQSYRGSGQLEGRAALITGGDSGIGRAVAIAFAREGADVAIAYYSEEADAQETLSWVEKAGQRGVSLRADLTRREDCRRIVDRAVEELGRLDIVVNNAAFQCECEDPAELDPEQIERTFRTNILAHFHVVQAALAHLKPGSVILNTGSVTAFDGNEGLLDYSATKGAVHTFTKSLARALAERGVRVSCVAPGPVWTPLIPSTLERSHVASFGENTLWGRPAQPAEIAPSFVFLAAESGRYYSGEILSPTGRVSGR